MHPLAVMEGLDGEHTPWLGPAGRAARAGNRPTPKSMMMCSAPAAASPAGILGTGWAALTNGFPIVYCPPVCEEARPLTDLGHVGSIVFGILLALVAIWSLWRARARPGWFMPAVAAALVVGTLVSLANTPIT